MPSKDAIHEVFESQTSCTVISIIKQVSSYQHIVNVKLPNEEQWQVLLEIGYKLTNMGFDTSNIIGMNVYGKYLNESPSYKEYIKDGKPSGNFSIIMTPIKSTYNIRDFDNYLNMVVVNITHKSICMLDGIICKFLIPRDYNGSTPICIRSINRDRSYPDQLFIHTDYISPKENPENICVNLINMYTGKHIYENHTKKSKSKVIRHQSVKSTKTYDSSKISVGGNSYVSALMQSDKDDEHNEMGGSAAAGPPDDSNIVAQIENIQKFAVSKTAAEKQINQLLSDKSKNHKTIEHDKDDKQKSAVSPVDASEAISVEDDDADDDADDDDDEYKYDYDDDEEEEEEEEDERKVQLPKETHYNDKVDDDCKVDDCKVDDCKVDDGKVDDGKVDDGKVDDGKVDDGKVDDIDGDGDGDDSVDEDIDSETNRIQINIPTPPAFNQHYNLSDITEWVQNVNKWYFNVFGQKCQ